MKNTSSSSSSGVGLPGLLTIVFVTLKLCHVIDWSWWWVLSPMWITASLVVLFLSVCALGYYTTRPKTPAEKAASFCRELSERLRK